MELMDEKKVKEFERELLEKSTSSELELEGRIFLVQKDENGKILVKEELDGDMILKALLFILSDTAEVVDEANSAELLGKI